MFNDYHYPYKWVVLKITYKGQVIYKVLAGFAGGYGCGNSWQINSGIESVELTDNGKLCFNSFSSSKYICHPEAYDMNNDMLGVYKSMTSVEVEDYSVEILDKNTDWLKLVDNEDETSDNMI